MKRFALAAAALVFAGAAQAQEDAMPANAEDVVWASAGDMDLNARIYRPEGADGAAPVVIDVHGGAWTFSDRTSGAYYDQGLADAGYLVIAIDFRQGADHPHPAASDDVAAAVRWARLNAADYGGDPEKIGLIGSSSGGHLAMLAALRPERAMQGSAVAGAETVSGDVDYVVAMWPVSDPLARFRYAQRAGIDGLLNGHNAYFGGDEAAMLDASIPRIVTAGEAGFGEDLPPVMVVQPGMDSNVPQDMTLDLIGAYQRREGHIEYAFYPGQGHAFGHREGAAADDMIAAVADFIARRYAD